MEQRENQPPEVGLSLPDSLAEADDSDDRERWTIREDGTVAAPWWRGHKRGKNWLAIIRGKNAAHMSRDFLACDRVDRSYAVAGICVGDALECGSDYISCSGIRYRDRDYFTVVGLSETEAVVERYPTAAQAIRAATRIKPR